MQKDGKLTDVRNSHRTTNGDIRCESTDRAVLDLIRYPLTLSLEPPVLDVWLDVSIIHAVDQVLPNQQTLSELLQAKLDTPNEISSEGLISYKKLHELLLSILKFTVDVTIKFNVIHSQTNSTKVLEKDGDSDGLQSREKLRVGNINFTTKVS
jgi:hypothetical protein